jgi:uncharacterized protein (DUF2237 family)
MKTRDFPGRGSQLNVLGGPLLTCSDKPVTGFFRDGCCNTSEDDFGSHTVCVVLTDEFLAYSKRPATTCRRRVRNSTFPASRPASAGAFAQRAGLRPIVPARRRRFH